MQNKKFILRSVGYLLLQWLLSAVLCLILAFSFAIFTQKIMRYLSLIFCLVAHCLLLSSAGLKLSDDALKNVRAGQPEPPKIFPYLMGFCAALPFWVCYALLWAMPNRSGYLNIFLLLQAPFLQIHRLILSGKEPFAALSMAQKIGMGLPPVTTVCAVVVGYLWGYLPGIARWHTLQEEKEGQEQRQ